MRQLIALVTLAATAAGFAALAAPTSAQARDIAWCARTWNRGFGGDDCMYYTYAQCRAAISGLRGECVPNPFSPNWARNAAGFGRDEPPPPPPRKHRQRRHHAR
ncbi:DUF3551 domain-containing protein [Bradyrhizobium sp. U87765 SZCCT0131]|uniref:DUF3551 domain-containing protein n=1 Tax=unclassified Bradyrhizobium TaxID=2631580 RepID=UPI001BA73AC5|nr:MULTISPECIES: DUF3551 domain-containing protein [unclassified Bradyrhizobium]MBR1222978.1 DUF3551 domain-containing protein [Bradyrhizobium sp. U87765 SZCCT0131]MBR1262714.1 DUF3551 domain-containing protein [Bradyrhizobium sp. U87765 SZCCT0134]MBR1308814.1 DUF3551 domain-containing protein [Bradyrhizobium sp. U87765 SZCCT0110]MBR1318496.1 DUF3551 domain-containing protein [Bradyrhizobium sp. U87765 SZCCT0109]MBR1352200.1 DUF3551 domain-containing protein [Bradyrhizobium sp. U87765 SZCCT004